MERERTYGVCLPHTERKEKACHGVRVSPQRKKKLAVEREVPTEKMNVGKERNLAKECWFSTERKVLWSVVCAPVQVRGAQGRERVLAKE